jgi:hypothetical protein
MKRRATPHGAWQKRSHPPVTVHGKLPSHPVYRHGGEEPLKRRIARGRAICAGRWRPAETRRASGSREAAPARAHDEDDQPSSTRAPSPPESGPKG